MALFFSRNMSLAAWEDKGMFEREVALYRRLVDRGVGVAFVTWGGPGERAFSARLPGIRVLCNRWSLPARWYERLIPYLHANGLRHCDVIKTNQTDGAGFALRAARVWNKPLVARCGYMLSEFLARAEDEDSTKAQAARDLEAEVFSAAAQVVVTTPMMAADAAARVPGCAERTTVIPNYVDTDMFKPLEGPPRTTDLLFLGRLAPQKNVEALLEAVAPLDAALTIVGDGPLRPAVEKASETMGARMTWHSALPHESLPETYNGARIFVLPSHYEGHPKALIEAMACGMAAIAGDAPGIRELIRHGETGWLCGTDPGAIREAIVHVLGDEALRRRLGENARSHALRSYALDRIVEREMEVLERVVGRAA